MMGDGSREKSSTGTAATCKQRGLRPKGFNRNFGNRLTKEGERSCQHTLSSRELKPSIKKSSTNIGLESKQRLRVILSKCSQPMESTKSLKVIRWREWSL